MYKNKKLDELKENIANGTVSKDDMSFELCVILENYENQSNYILENKAFVITYTPHDEKRIKEFINLLREYDVKEIILTDGSNSFHTIHTILSSDVKLIGPITTIMNYRETNNKIYDPLGLWFEL